MTATFPVVPALVHLLLVILRRNNILPPFLHPHIIIPVNLFMDMQHMSSILTNYQWERQCDRFLHHRGLWTILLRRLLGLPRNLAIIITNNNLMDRISNRKNTQTHILIIHILLMPTIRPHITGSRNILHIDIMCLQLITKACFLHRSRFLNRINLNRVLILPRKRSGKALTLNGRKSTETVQRIPRFARNMDQTPIQMRIGRTGRSTMSTFGDTGVTSDGRNGVWNVHFRMYARRSEKARKAKGTLVKARTWRWMRRIEK